MKLEGEHLFEGPREEVWQLVRDPDVLSSALPGTQKFTQLSEYEYEGAIHLAVGPVSGDFAGKLVVSNERPNEGCTLTVDGKGAPGYVKGVGNVELSDQPNNCTLLKYTGELEIGGKLANVGQRLMDTVSKSMVKQGFASLDAVLKARLEAKSGGKAAEYVAPTEAAFAKEVAKDVAKETMGIAEVRMLLYVIPVGLALAAVAYFLSRCTGGG